MKMSASSIVLSGQKDALMELSASLGSMPKAVRAELTLLEWDEQAEPEDTYTPLEDRK